MIKGAIFDIDGTLLNSMHIWATVGTEYLKSIGYTPKPNLNDVFMNMSLFQAARYYKEEYGVTKSIDEIISGVHAMIDDFYRNRAQLKDGALELLNYLENSGVKMCIATATDLPLMGPAIRRCGIDRYFSAVFTCSAVGHGKDEPDIYRIALDHLGTPRGETMVFEDSLYALKTAKNDGFLTAAVYDDHEWLQDEMRETGDVYIGDLTDLGNLKKFMEENEK